MTHNKCSIKDSREVVAIGVIMIIIIGKQLWEARGLVPQHTQSFQIIWLVWTIVSGQKLPSPVLLCTA
jgi:hypothetical protein